MQRWFYANEELVCVQKHDAKTPESVVAEDEIVPKPRTWRFCVKVNDRELMPNETLAVSGNCAQLGDWQFEKCVLMSPLTEGCLDKWHVYIDLPVDKVVRYRYLIVAIDPESDQMIVRFFESHIKTRKVRPQAGVADVCEDVFGVVKDLTKVERGWLTTERILQIMFFKAPFSWLEGNDLRDHIMQVKLTPLHRRELDPCAQTSEYTSKPNDLISEFSEHKEETNSVKKTQRVKSPRRCGKRIPSYTKLVLKDCKDIDSMFPPKDEKKVTIEEVNENPLTNKPNVTLSTAFAFNEVINFRHRKDILRRQPVFGTPCGAEDLTLFHLTIGDFDNTVYLIELFTYSKNAGDAEDPYLVGYRYLLPEDMESASSGFIQAPIVCASTHRMLGRMCFKFLVIRPAEELKFDLSTSHIRHWTSKHLPLDVGHRGQGVTYQTDDGTFIFENTIYSIQMAVENGADMVEFDVQLTKDAVPVVYHDFNVHVSQLDPNLIETINPVSLPLNKLTFKELRKLKLPKTVVVPPPLRPNTKVGDATEREQLFPLLAEVMDEVDESIAFDVEIKWPQQYCNGRWEENVKPRFDRNVYIDRILKVIMSKAGNRRIVLSCFEADMCTMLRFKQNRYPVMFLLPDEREKPYHDARSNYCPVAINFAYGMELLGVIPNTYTILHNLKYFDVCLELKLTIFCYDVHIPDDPNLLKSLRVSVDAVILDRMDELNKQEGCTCPCERPSITSSEDGSHDKAGGDSISFKSLDTWND